MKEAAQPAPARIDVDLATREQAPVLANLLELYAHDFSELLALELGEDGRFGYARLPLYWKEPGRHPFFIRADGKLAGLALVNKGSEISGDPGVWDMAEFFVVRGWRRRGIGLLAAEHLWQHLPGSWEVRVAEVNVPAQLFWERAIEHFTGKAVEQLSLEQNGRNWRVFSFAAPLNPPPG